MDDLNNYRFVEFFVIADGNVRLATNLYPFVMRDFPHYDSQATPDDLRKAVSPLAHLAVER